MKRLSPVAADVRHEPGRDALLRVLADQQVGPTRFMDRRTRSLHWPIRLLTSAATATRAVPLCGRQFSLSPSEGERAGVRGNDFAIFILFLALLGIGSSNAAVVTEDFSTLPASRSWRTFGDGSLFAWNPTNQALDVTWDSSHTNSLFYRPLGTVLTKGDDFSLGFDLRLRDIAIGVNPEKPYTFQIALGLCKLSSITNGNFFRGAGVNRTFGPRNLVEFNYFPAFGEFAPTIAQVVVTTNGQWFYNHDNLLEMLPGDLFNVTMQFRETRLTTVVKRNGQNYGNAQIIEVQSADSDYRIDTFAIASYSDGGQSPPQFSGSILAHGSVDNVSWTVPDPPLIVQRGARVGNFFRVDFDARSNWVYRLEVTTRFQQWYLVAEGFASTNGPMFLQDTQLASDRAFYRVLGDRP